jgi:hypothetical protein
MPIVRRNERSHWKSSAALSLTLCLTVGSVLQAQESADMGHAAGVQGAHEAHEARFAVAAFVGATRAHGSNESTLGLEGGYRISATWSVGGVVERADRERDSTLVLIGVGWHPLGSAWRFQVGLGRKDPAGEQEAVFRTGIAYEKELHQGWFVKPYLAKDFIQHADDEEVFGAYFGRSF